MESRDQLTKSFPELARMGREERIRFLLTVVADRLPDDRR